MPARPTEDAILRSQLRPPTGVRSYEPNMVWSQAVWAGGYSEPQAVHYGDIGSIFAIHSAATGKRLKALREPRHLRWADLHVYKSATLREGVHSAILDFRGCNQAGWDSTKSPHAQRLVVEGASRLRAPLNDQAEWFTKPEWGRRQIEWTPAPWMDIHVPSTRKCCGNKEFCSGPANILNDLHALPEGKVHDEVSAEDCVGERQSVADRIQHDEPFIRLSGAHEVSDQFWHDITADVLR
jgi:hypothetical protein